MSVLLVLLACLYVVFFTDLFAAKSIEVTPMIRPSRILAPKPSDPFQPSVFPVTFLMRGNWNLTSIKVVSVQELKTQKYPVPVWHLISDSNSVPTRSFFYGERIRGMKPGIPRARPEPLQPNVEYVLLLEAGKVKGRANFHTRELVQAQR